MMGNSSAWSDRSGIEVAMTVSGDGVRLVSAGAQRGGWVAPQVLVGRDRELVELRGLLGDVVAGRGGVVWVEGEPGIGKSALIAAGLAEAPRLGCEMFWGSASELQLASLQPVLDALGVGRGSVDALRAPLAALLRGDGLAGVVTPRDVAAMLAEQVLILLDRLCAAGPVALVLDDAQWADEVSLSVWSRLGSAAGQMPLLLVGACRPVPQRAVVKTLRRDLTDRGARVVRLAGLPPARVAELVAELVAAGPGGRLGDRLAAAVGQAGGNPLYVREVVDALLLDGRIRVEHGVAELEGEGRLPDSLPAAIERRLEFLPEDARSLLRMAALFEPAFSVADLAVLTRASPTDLLMTVDEAITAGVLTGAGERLMFRHGLIRQALYQAMQASVRAAMHRQAAQALAKAGAPVERVAEQLLAGPQAVDRWTIDWVAAAAAALTLRAPRLAADLLQRVRAGSDVGDPWRERLDADLAAAFLMLGDNEQVERVAYPVLASSRDPAMIGRVAWTLGYALMRMGRYERTVEVNDQALALGVLPAVWTARLHAQQAMGLLAGGRYDEARAAAVLAETEGHQAGDRLAVAYALHALAMVEVRQRQLLVSPAEMIDRALAVLGDDHQATDLRLLLLINRAAWLLNVGRPVEAERAYGQVLRFAEQSATPPRLAGVRTQVSQANFWRGQWDEALAELKAADELPLDAESRLLARGMRALIAVHRDDRAFADSQLRGIENLELTVGKSGLYAGVLLVTAWASAAERDGQPAQALARLLGVFDPEATRQFPQLTVDSWVWLREVVRLALALGDRPTAAAATHACATDADRQARPATNAAAQHCKGLLGADPAQMCAAADTFHRIGYPLFQAQALEDAAVLQAEHGDLQDAQAAYLAAVNTYSDLDAAWDIIRADARLRPHNIHRGRRGPRARPTAGWESLTPTEQRIAALVAARESNADIAAQLLLSRRTVETHVSHILHKLKARSRIDIVREYTSATKLS
jgi:DNA-binding CsgD family transcriptional regulator